MPGAPGRTRIVKPRELTGIDERGRCSGMTLELLLAVAATYTLLVEHTRAGASAPGGWLIYISLGSPPSGDPHE